MELDSEIAVEKPSGSDSILPASPTKSIDAAAVILSNAEYRKLIWKLDLHLLPPLFILWFISLIDRVNIGAARIQGLEKDLGMNPLSNQFNIATGMRFDKYSNWGLVKFFSSCCLHRSHDRRGNQTKSVIWTQNTTIEQVPSNWLVKRYTPASILCGECIILGMQYK